MVEYARDKAEFCIATGQPASEYDRMTVIEINEFIHAANRAARSN